MSEPKEFLSVFARNCEVRRIAKAEAGEFLRQYHRLGDAACRYRYGLFVRKVGKDALPEGTMVAVATFSAARRILVQGKLSRSCEWVRYASLTGVRVAGGMSKVLKAFVEEVKPEDVMSYADARYSDGEVYRRLGFVYEGRKCFAQGYENLKFRYIVKEGDCHGPFGASQ